MSSSPFDNYHYQIPGHASYKRCHSTSTTLERDFKVFMGNYTLGEASYNYYRHRQVNSQVNDHEKSQVKQEKTLKRDMRILPPTPSATDKSIINSNSPSTPTTAPSPFSSPLPGVSTQQDEHHVKIKEENDDVEGDMKTCTYSSDNDNESD